MELIEAHPGQGTFLHRRADIRRAVRSIHFAELHHAGQPL
jgi:hypothetical protein